METRTKERLTGALILVVVMVILVPELLSGRAPRDKSGEVPIAAPATEGPPLRSYTLDLAARPDAAKTDQTALNVRPAEGAGASLPAPVPAPETPPAPVLPPAASSAASAAAVKPQPSAEVLLKPDPAPPQEPQVKTPAKAAPETPKVKATPSVELAAPVAAAAKAKPVAASAAGHEKGWFVQVGSFAKRENAASLVKQLAAKGHGAQLVGGTGGGLYRVRVGPVADRHAAAALQSHLAEQGFKGASISAP